MAKRKLPDTKIAFEPDHGYNVTTGNRLNLDGSLKRMKFYLGYDHPEALRRKIIIKREWKAIRDSGGNHWTEAAFERLAQFGITIKSRVKNNEALAHYDEPLTDPQLKPLLDERGMIRPDCAVKAMELDAANVFTDPAIRSKFHQQIKKAALNDPWSTLERAKRTFDWNGQQAMNFFFNINGGGVTGGIAFDASGTKSGDAIHDLGDLIDVEKVQPAPPKPDAF